MGRLLRKLWRAACIPVLAALRCASAMAVLCMAWFFDARLLNTCFDANLAFIKSVGAAMDGSGRVEAALRALSAERMLLFAEATMLLWALGKTVSLPIMWMFSRGKASRLEPPRRPPPPKAIPAASRT